MLPIGVGILCPNGSCRVLSRRAALDHRRPALQVRRRGFPDYPPSRPPVLVCEKAQDIE